MRTLKYFFGLTLTFLFLSVTSYAQVEWNDPLSNAVNNTTTDIQRSGKVGIGISAPLYKLHLFDAINTTNSSAAKINFSNNAFSIATQGLNVESIPLNTKGAQTGVFAQTSSTYPSKVGEAAGYLSHTKAFAGDGGFSGVLGVASATTLTNSNTLYSRILGGDFHVASTTNVNLNGNNFWVAGMKATLSGTINNTPTNGAVAAVIGIDDNQGNAASWAGYFQGRGHFSQNVGINTTNPQARLSVNGDGNSLYGGYITSTSQGTGSTGLRVEMPANVGFADQNFGVTSVIEAGYGYTTGVYGIATTISPSANGRSYGVRGIAGNANVNFGVYSQLTGSNRGAALFAVDQIKHPSYNEVINGNWAAYMIGDGHISDRLSIGTTKMPNNLNGYSLANYKLYVNGGILANEFLIPNVIWADYVFEDDYELTALEDVKEHIEENGHLHNTPSSETVENEGLKVAEMTINQQEKIEEIFLHLIEMNEELKTLKAENEALKAEIKSLK